MIFHSRTSFLTDIEVFYEISNFTIIHTMFKKFFLNRSNSTMNHVNTAHVCALLSNEKIFAHLSEERKKIS